MGAASAGRFRLQSASAMAPGRSRLARGRPVRRGTRPPLTPFVVTLAGVLCLGPVAWACRGELSYTDFTPRHALRADLVGCYALHVGDVLLTGRYYNATPRVRLDSAVFSVPGDTVN